METAPYFCVDFDAIGTGLWFARRCWAASPTAMSTSTIRPVRKPLVEGVATRRRCLPAAAYHLPSTVAARKIVQRRASPLRRGRTRGRSAPAATLTTRPGSGRGEVEMRALQLDARGRARPGSPDRGRRRRARCRGSSSASARRRPAAWPRAGRRSADRAAPRAPRDRVRPVASVLSQLISLDSDAAASRRAPKATLGTISG